MASFDQPRSSDVGVPVDPVPGRLWALLGHLRAHDLVADLAKSGRSVTVSPQGRPGAEVRVSCRVRRDDGGQLWFFGPEARPLAEAEDLRSAVVAVKGLLAELP